MIGVKYKQKILINYNKPYLISINNEGHCGRDCMVVEFTTTCAISTYRH